MVFIFLSPFISPVVDAKCKLDKINQQQQKIHDGLCAINRTPHPLVTDVRVVLYSAALKGTECTPFYFMFICYVSAWFIMVLSGRARELVYWSLAKGYPVLSYFYCHNYNRSACDTRKYASCPFRKIQWTFYTNKLLKLELLSLLVRGMLEQAHFQAGVLASANAQPLIWELWVKILTMSSPVQASF